MKLLLADDEVITRKGLHNNINWKSLGITEIREVEDGQEGVELLERYAPDVLLTDIRMPFINGIELAIKTKERYPNCKIIFLSGFSDKEYLKAAIHLGAVNYIEKPIDLEELYSTIQKAIDLHNDEKNYMSSEELKKMLVEKMIRAQDNMLLPRKILKKIHLDFEESSYYHVLIIRHTPTIVEENYVLERIGEKLVDAFGLTHVLGVEKDQQNVLWIIEHEANEFIDKVKEIKNNLVIQYPELNKQLFYAVGSEVKGVENIYQSYQTAVIHLQVLFWSGYGNIATSLPKIDSDQKLSFEILLSDFQQRLNSDSDEKIMDWIKQQFMSIKLHKNAMSNEVKNHVFQMTLKLYESNYMEMPISKDENKNPYLWEQIFKIETLGDLYQYFMEKLKLFLSNKEISNQYSQSVRKAIEIINAQYMRLDLSTKDLAQEVFLTTSYLSNLFKQETGETVGRYIQKVRVENSKKLLQQKQLSLAEIAEKVGYRDANYYAKVFKKIYGYSPSDFRERL